VETVTISISGKIMTDYLGHSQIMNFYHTCKKIKNRIVNIDFSNLRWFDANLVALLSATIYKLRNDNSLDFVTDLDFLNNNFDIFCRNGFIQTSSPREDDRKSTLPFKIFSPKDKDGFKNYIKEDLLSHRGMPKLTTGLRFQIYQDLFEIFANYDYHSNSQEYFFICGQFYPKYGFLKLTMVDVGDGFLPNIQKVTRNRIFSADAAIRWAVEGNTTKTQVNTPGGLGIRGIHNYMLESNGRFDIITGDAYWSTYFSQVDLPNGCLKVNNTFCGTTINLSFNCN